MSGLGALKRLGEFLMRQSENDERLARAVEQGYDLLNPMVHGTNKPLPVDESLRPLFLTRDPDMALNYTGGGRRAGPGSPARGGLSQVMVLRRQPIEGDASVMDIINQDNLDILKTFGVEDPSAFRRAVREKNYRASNKRAIERGDTQGELLDNLFGIWAGNDPAAVRSSVTDFYQLLDNPGFVQTMREMDLPPWEFHHPYVKNTISPRGRVLRDKLDEQGHATAIFAPDSSILRSPWAEFKEEGIGLMKKEGGLVK